jgi:pyruvate/2-oxoglutarate dehydrogenase complex dihydrolipoamide acyltransferase (E2) component
VTATNDGGFDQAERWLFDSLRVLRPAFAAYQLTVDMTNAMARLEELRRQGVTATPTHLLIHAAARGLAANPALHRLIAGSRRYRPERIDIGLSISGETFVAPVLVIEAADSKSVADIAAETARRVPEVQAAEKQHLAGLRRWGWLLPFGFLRRLVMRAMFANPSFRRQSAGTFQVSTVPVEWAATSIFVATGVLVGGQVRSRVIPVDGQPAVRPTMVVTLSGDHGIWDGRAAARFLATVKTVLEAR